MCGMKSLVHSQTSTVGPLEFEEGYVILFHTTLGIKYLSMVGFILVHVII